MPFGFFFLGSGFRPFEEFVLWEEVGEDGVAAAVGGAGGEIDW